MEPKTKKLAILIYGALALLVIIFGLSAWWSSKQNAELADTGIRTIATITDMRESKTSRKAQSHYYVTVSYFADTSRKEPQTASTSSTPKTPQELKEEALKTISGIQKNLTIGDYQTANVEVRGELYVSLTIGDKVNIIFDPKDNSRVLLRGKVEN